MRTSILAAALAAIGLAASPALATADPLAGLTAMRQLNLIVFSDLNQGQHVQGKAWVGGNLNSLTVAQGNGSQKAQASNYATLTVGGNAGTYTVENNIGEATSTVKIGGNSTGTATLNGTSASHAGNVATGGTFNANAYNPNASKTYTQNVGGLQGSIAATTAELVQDLTSLSGTLAGLSGTTVTSLGSALAYGSGSYQVFNMSEAVFETQNGNFDTLFGAMPTGITTIVNVAGTNIAQDQGANINLASLNQNVIWNFYQATDVSLKGWHGSVLAPLATLSNSSSIEGSVVSRVFNMNGEVHLGTFAGTSAMIPTTTAPVPEPASWVMMILGFGAVGTALRARRRTSAAA